MATEVIVEIKITNRETSEVNPQYVTVWETSRRRMSYDFKLARSTADPEALLATLVDVAQDTA